MGKNDFQTAVARAKTKYGTQWLLMSPKAQTVAIYEELRELDQMAARHRRRSLSRSQQGTLETQ